MPKRRMQLFAPQDLNWLRQDLLLRGAAAALFRNSHSECILYYLFLETSQTCGENASCLWMSSPVREETLIVYA